MLRGQGSEPRVLALPHLLCPLLPRDHSEQLNNTERGFNSPQYRGQLPRDAYTSERGPGKGRSSRPSLEGLGGRQARSLLRNKRPGKRFTKEGEFPQCLQIMLGRGPLVLSSP